MPIQSRPIHPILIQEAEERSKWLTFFRHASAFALGGMATMGSFLWVCLRQSKEGPTEDEFHWKKTHSRQYNGTQEDWVWVNFAGSPNKTGTDEKAIMTLSNLTGNPASVELDLGNFNAMFIGFCVLMVGILFLTLVLEGGSFFKSKLSAFRVRRRGHPLGGRGHNDASPSPNPINGHPSPNMNTNSTRAGGEDSSDAESGIARTP